MLFLWPQVAWHALRPGDLFWAPQPLSEWNFEMQVCSGLCCVWPLAEEDKHMDVPVSVHRPFGHGSSVSGGRWSDVPRAHLSTPPAYPRCGAGSRVACQGLSPQFHFGGTVYIYSHWGYNEGALTPVETELSLCNGVIQAFWADQKREQSQAKLRIQELPPDLCPLGRFKTVFWERRAVCGAWCKYDITLTDFDTFMLDLHQCYPEWHLALLVLINHRSWHSICISCQMVGRFQKWGLCLERWAGEALQPSSKLRWTWRCLESVRCILAPLSSQVLWPCFFVHWREGGCV